MMTFSENAALENCKRFIYRRIQLAAAIFVIKSTPEGKAPEAHAADIQQRLRTHWLNSSFLTSDNRLNSCANQHILTQQQNVLSSRLCSLLPPSIEDYSSDNRSYHDANQKHLEANNFHIYLDSLKVNENKLEENANFIHTVVQLKVLAEAHSIIPRENYIRSISKVCENQRERLALMNESQQNLSCFVPNHDSGFCKAEEYNFAGYAQTGRSAPVTGVASSVLLYIVNSCNADELLKKSIQGILNHLKNVACANETEWSVLGLEETVNQWMGSVYQQALNALHSAIGINAMHSDIFNHSFNLCISFIQEIVLNIIHNKAIKEIGYSTKENQILMVLKISGGTELWLQSLKFIFSCLLTQAESLRSKHLYQTESIITDFQERKNLIKQSQNYFQDIEDCVFLFRLVRTFLTMATQNLEFIEHKENHISSNSEHKTTRIIAELWRKHHQVAVHSLSSPKEAVDRVGKIKFYVRQWKQFLEESFEHIMFEHPLIAIIISECLQLLPSLDR